MPTIYTMPHCLKAYILYHNFKSVYFNFASAYKSITKYTGKLYRNDNRDTSSTHIQTTYTIIPYGRWKTLKGFRSPLYVKWRTYYTQKVFVKYKVMVNVSVWYYVWCLFLWFGHKDIKDNFAYLSIYYMYISATLI